MILFIEGGIRGGVSMTSNRHGKANNNYMGDYDPSEESKNITYLDANNLYGWGMSQKPPYKNFRWVNEKKLIDLNPFQINADGDTGYILQVDLEYPKKLQNLHNDYPMVPENITINKGDQLTPNLNNKTKHI